MLRNYHVFLQYLAYHNLTCSSQYIQTRGADSITYFVRFSYINVPLDYDLLGLLRLQLEVRLQIELLRKKSFIVSRASVSPRENITYIQLMFYSSHRFQYYTRLQLELLQYFLFFSLKVSSFRPQEAIFSLKDLKNINTCICCKDRKTHERN